MTTDVPTAPPRPLVRVPQWLVIALVCMAGLLLEVGYTRIVSYKLWYYYTYLVIGLSLLGIGSGGVLVAMSKRIRSATTTRIVAASGIWSAITIGVGYWVIAAVRIETITIWDYGTAESFTNIGLLALICFSLFAAFVGLGVIIAVLLGRAGERVNRLYFADLTGAALGCVLAIPLITWMGPPRLIILAALVFGVVGLACVRRAPVPVGLASVTCAALVVVLVSGSLLPLVRPERGKIDGYGAEYSAWGPVFRVDVMAFEEGSMVLSHNGTFGSRIQEWDGDIASLDKFDRESRSLPFATAGDPMERVLIIGSAGGHEILGSLYFGTDHIEAVELNPVTTGLLDDEFAEYSGNLATQPGVEIHQGDGRHYLASSGHDYDLIWFVAPDSYSAANAASSGAMVLSESYLYTWQMMREALERLSPGGIMVAQFGELNVDRSSNRTNRYLVTARKALEELGVEDPGRHLLVATEETTIDFSTIIVKPDGFTDEEIAAFTDKVAELDAVSATAEVPASHTLRHADGHVVPDGPIELLASGSDEEVAAFLEEYPKDISVVSDDAPFFWHFSPFPDVLSNIFDPLDVRDPEEVIGERVLLLLLAFSVLFAAVFLLMPFFVIRREWTAFPAKGTSALYFAALGLGFMLYEITMIQRLVRFLGYPTYSLTVTLAAILVTTGLGALLSQRFSERSVRAAAVTLGFLAALTLFYRFGLDDLTDAFQGSALGVRILVALAVLAPLGLCLGMFMPFGLRGIAALTNGPEQEEQYVAWSWAVNGFFSVVGAVLTTILSMTFGFTRVQLGAFVVYAIAVVALWRLRAASPGADDPAAPPVVPKVDAGV